MSQALCVVRNHALISAVLEGLIFCAGGTPEIGFCRVFERGPELSSIFVPNTWMLLRQINDDGAKTISDPQKYTHLFLSVAERLSQPQVK